MGHTPTTLTMKGALTKSAKNDHVDSSNNNLGEYNMIKEKGINNQ